MMRDKAPIFFTGAMIGALSVLTWLGGAARPTHEEPQVTQGAPEQQPMRCMARVTAYCPCEKCCGKFSDGLTSTGTDAWRTRGVAVDPRVIPYGTPVHIEGVGTLVADDTGKAMKRGDQLRLDVRFPTHQEALEFGVQTLEVTFVR